MLLLLLNYVVLRALWKIDVHLISTLVNKSLIIIIIINGAGGIVVWCGGFVFVVDADVVDDDDVDAENVFDVGHMVQIWVSSVAKLVYPSCISMEQDSQYYSVPLTLSNMPLAHTL